jgi:hypothetical protein
MTIHLKSPAGEMRERETSCTTCRASTWNICARCDRHCDCGPQVIPSLLTRIRPAAPPPIH